MVYFANGTVHYVTSAGDAHFKSLAVSGDISAQRVYDAVYNDYAELMPRGEQTEPGDIIALDTGSQTERYIKATNLSGRIAGIHTDEYAMLIGGNMAVGFIVILNMIAILLLSPKFFEIFHGYLADLKWKERS